MARSGDIIWRNRRRKFQCSPRYFIITLNFISVQRWQEIRYLHRSHLLTTMFWLPVYIRYRALYTLPRPSWKPALAWLNKLVLLNTYLLTYFRIWNRTKICTVSPVCTGDEFGTVPKFARDSACLHGRFKGHWQQKNKSQNVVVWC